ncbi:hypothetical protein ACFQ6N_33130 [Kitasatospora sp. NPDC056446]|uniref:hypothetical protein n=1 Tax=Kitasatospora sp. NPDC056446 TaxID=3345819 RepID=UPI00367C088F
MTRTPGETRGRREPAPADARRAHRQQTYTADPGMYGERRSATGGPEALGLGAGHGRDAPHLARAGFPVLATDFSPDGLPSRLRRITQETPR